MWQLRRNTGSEIPVGAHRTEPTLAPNAEPQQSAVSSRMVSLKVQIHQQLLERINLSMTDLGDLFEKVWLGRNHSEQWPLLAQLVKARDPQRCDTKSYAVVRSVTPSTFVDAQAQVSVRPVIPRPLRRR